MILLVSDQPMANLQAALHPELGVGEVHLVVSGDMQANGRGDWLAEVLEARGLACRWHSVAEPWDPAPTRSLVSRLVADDPERWIVNLTGGTKPMSIGADRAAIEAGVRDLLYLEADSGRLRWLWGNRPPLTDIVRIKVSETLRAHGYRADIGRPAPDDWAALAEAMDQALVGKTQQAWNRLFFEAGKRLKAQQGWNTEPVAVAPQVAGIPAIAELLERAQSLKLCAWSGTSLTILTAEAHQFLAGGWLELLAYRALAARREALGLQDLALNLRAREAGGASNEVDVAAMRGRRLLLLECKTGRVDGGEEGQKASDIVYKLEHLGRLGGSRTALFLVSRELPDGKIVKRFEAAGVALVKAEGKGWADSLAEAISRLPA